MKKMESKKLRSPRWWDSLIGPKNSNSKWVQENLEEMNRNVTRMLKVIENSSAESRQELIKLVVKCYSIHCSLAERCNHGTGEVLNYIPNSHLIRSHAPDITSLPLLSQHPSSKKFNNVHERSVSKQLKRRVSVKGSNNHIRGQITKCQASRSTYDMCMDYSSGYNGYGGYGSGYGGYGSGYGGYGSGYGGYGSGFGSGKSQLQMSLDLWPKPEPPSSNYFSNYYSYTQSDDNDDEVLEAEICDMIVKLYIQLEGDRVDKALLEEKLDLNVRGVQSQQPVKISTRPPPLPPIIRSKSQSESDYSFSSSNYSDTQSVGDDDEEEELEAELHNMIVKLYIQLEGDRVDKALLGEKLDLNVRGLQSQQPVKISTRPPSLPPIIRSKSQSESDYSFSSSNYSDTQSVGDDDEEELEAELHNMIVKLYIQLEGDRVDKALLEEKLDLNVRGLQSQQQVKISTRPPPLPPIIRSKSQSESDYSFSSSDYSDTQNNDDDGDELGHDELEAELHNMIEKLYIELEWDRVVSKFQGEILKYEDHTHDDDEEFISSNVDKALLEENLKLQAEISRLLKEMSYLEEYNEEIEAVVAERDQLKARVATLTADLRVYLEGTPGVVNQCSSF